MQNTATGEVQPITGALLEELRTAGYPVLAAPGRQVVQVPPSIFRKITLSNAHQHQLAQATAQRRAGRKQADRSRRAQRRK